MEMGQTIETIYQQLTQFIPMFRIIWAGTIVLGIALCIIAFILKKKKTRKMMPWIVGAIGIVMICSSGGQLIACLL